MQPTLIERPQQTGYPDEIAHLFCPNCPLDMAVCGYIIDGEIWTEADIDEDTCPLCIEMDDYPCPRCGAMA